MENYAEILELRYNFLTSGEAGFFSLCLKFKTVICYLLHINKSNTILFNHNYSKISN